MLRRLGTLAFANAYLLLTLTALFWAGNLVAGRALAGAVPPMTLSAIRWLVSAALLTPFAWSALTRDWPAARRAWPVLAVLCLISAYHVTLNYVALNHTTALNTLTLNSLTPILIVLIAWALYGDTMSRRQLAGIALSFAGALGVIAHGDLAALAALSFNRGDLIVAGNFAMLALYTVLLRKRPLMHWLGFTALLYLSAALLNLPLAALELADGRRPELTPQVLAGIAYVSIFPSLIAYIFYNRGVELIGSQRAGAFMHLVPLFGALMAVLLLGEELRVYHVAGFALIVAGVALAARPA